MIVEVSNFSSVVLLHLTTISCRNLKTHRHHNRAPRQSPLKRAWNNRSLRKSRAGPNHVIILTSSIRFQNVFRPHENEKPAFTYSPCLKSVFEKLRFRDGLVWALGLTGEIKLRFKFLQRQEPYQCSVGGVQL